MIYETAADIEAEDRIAEEAAQAWLLKQRRRPKLDPIDREFMSLVGAPLFYAECKQRRWAFGAGDGLRCDRRKWEAAEELAARTGLGTVFIGRFEGELHWAYLAPAQDCGLWGRASRNDPRPSVVIPWELFHGLDRVPCQ